MRRLDDTDKQIIKNIIHVKDNEYKTVGSLIAHLFKANESAILVHDKIYLLIAENYDSTSILVLIVKIISLFDSLQREGYIYLIPTKDYLFLQDGFESSVSVNTYGDISCCRGVFNRDGTNVELVLDNQSFVSIDIQEEFGNALKIVLCNFVYPSAKLHELVKNDFLFGDELRYKVELRYTRIGLYISLLALFISIGAPFYMTEYNNHHSITTIDTIQINRIEQAIKDNKYNAMKNTSSSSITDVEHIKDTTLTVRQLDSTINRVKSRNNTCRSNKQY